MAKLRALGLDDRTLVVFTSDNGAYFGGSNGGLRGMKTVTSKGGLRVPCIAHWLGRIPAGQTLVAPAVLNDWFPTLLASAGGALPGDWTIDGRTLWPVLAEKSTQLHEAIFGFQGTTLRTVRSDRWKLHVEASQPRALRPSNRSGRITRRGCCPHRNHGSSAQALHWIYQGIDGVAAAESPLTHVPPNESCQS